MMLLLRTRIGPTWLGGAAATRLGSSYLGSPSRCHRNTACYSSMFGNHESENHNNNTSANSSFDRPGFLTAFRHRVFSNQAQKTSLDTADDMLSSSTLPNTEGSRLYPLRPRRRSPNKQPTSFEKGYTGDSLLPVSALHIAQAIDLYAVASSIFARRASRKQVFSKNSIVVEFPSRMPKTTTTTTTENCSESSSSYVAVFRFGSIVGVNISPQQLAAFASEIKKHAVEPVVAGFERRENFAVLLNPPTKTKEQEKSFLVDASRVDHIVEESTAETEVVTGDAIIVAELDMNGVAVISNIMAQTVALDSYNDTVDELLTNFAKINSTVSRTGNFSAADKTFLFKTVAQNNSIFIDMISRVRLKDRSETAWSMVKYEKIHYGMKEEFEIDDRFDQIEFKLNLIQKNAKFFLDVLHHQSSNSLEWIIVVLITVECVLMCVEMSGMGESLFTPITQLFYS